jgi:curved DNA-binding protein CbpA
VSSPFEILRITPDADDEEVERAYRDRIVETHPDQGGSREQLQLVRDAYDELSADGADARQIQREEVAKSEEDNEGDESDTQQDLTTVEYLNYAVLDDYGWVIDDDHLFDKAADADLAAEDYGRFVVEPDESLLEAAENRGYAWPFACRGGACANCAVAVTEGELEMSIDHVLPEEMVEHDIRLSCIGQPTTESLKVVYNVKQLPDLAELKLPADRFEKARSSG